MQHLDAGCVPLEGHVLVVCRFHQNSIAYLGERTFADILVEEDFLVDEAKIILNLGDVTSAAENTLIRIKLGRVLATHLCRRLGLRLVLKSNRIDWPRRWVLHSLGVNLSHLRNQGQVLLLLQTNILVKNWLSLRKTNDVHPSVSLPWRILVVESHFESLFFLPLFTALPTNSNSAVPVEQSPPMPEKVLQDSVSCTIKVKLF